MKAKAIGMVMAMFFVGLSAGTAKADFVKMGSEHLDVTTSYDKGILYDSSTADVLAGGYIGEAYVNDNALLTVDGLSGTRVYKGYIYNNGRMEIVSGRVGYLHTEDTSGVDISGGTVYDLYADDKSTADISGGTVTHLYTYDNSTADISGGVVDDLYAYDTSGVDISGGTVTYLMATGIYNRSTTTFHGYGFRATGGLSLVEFDVIDGFPQYEVIGTGILTGEWRDGRTWITTISRSSTATILAIPEPASLSLLTLGGLAVLRRRRR